MSTITEAYQCGSCGTWHGDADDAKECCSPGIVDGWKCDSCGEYHTLKTHAENCCSFQCAECREWNDEAGMICEHCGHDTASDPISPSALEAVGQVRLIP